MRLRAATDAIHRAIDRKVSEGAFLATIDGYGAYLDATWRARRAIEDRLDACRAATIYPSWRRLGAVLELDLADLRLARPAVERFDPFASLGAVWGALYVLEGSALGARMILPRVTRLGMSASFGARHLAHQAKDPGAWKHFLTQMEGVRLNADEEADCIETAIGTFARFARSYAPRSATMPI